jgi:hypothetical protein
MDTKIPYEDKEDEIRLALVKMAKHRKKLDYMKFGELVNSHRMTVESNSR